jgi:hypothetical protein
LVLAECAEEEYDEQIGVDNSHLRFGRIDYDIYQSKSIFDVMLID